MTTPDPKRPRKPPPFTKTAADWHGRVKAQRAELDEARERYAQANDDILAAEAELVSLQREAAADLGLTQVDW